MQIRQSEFELSSEHVVTLPRQFVSETWNGEKLAQPFRWALAIDPQRLWFIGELPAPPCSVRHHAQGEFVEGLWEADVIELFLRGEDGRYQELNVSVDGAWWSMEFVSYRQRRPGTPRPSGIEVLVERYEQSWTAGFSIPISQCIVPLVPGLSVHVSGIIHGGQGVRYITSQSRPSFAPDFHDERCFVRAEWHRGLTDSA